MSRRHAVIDSRNNHNCCIREERERVYKYKSYTVRYYNMFLF